MAGIRPIGGELAESRNDSHCECLARRPTSQQQIHDRAALRGVFPARGAMWTCQDERQTRRLLDEDASSAHRPDGHATGARTLKQVERPHRAQAMPAKRSGGAGRSKDAVRRTIDNVIGRGRAEQRVFIANRQPGDGTENRVTRLRKIHGAGGCGRSGIALAALWPRANGPLP